jgi:hypothetical protein
LPHRIYGRLSKKKAEMIKLDEREEFVLKVLNCFLLKEAQEFFMSSMD